MINIKHLSNLANLTLTKDEEKLYLKQLEKVVSFVSHLEEVDTSGVTLSNTNNINNIYSQDNIKPSLPIEDVLFNSKLKHNNLFKVDIVLKNKIL